MSCAAPIDRESAELFPSFKKAASLGPRSGVNSTRLLGRLLCMDAPVRHVPQTLPPRRCRRACIRAADGSPAWDSFHPRRTNRPTSACIRALGIHYRPRYRHQHDPMNEPPFKLWAAQRFGVQRAAGRYHTDRSEWHYIASGTQNRPDPVAPLQRLVRP